MMKNLKKKNEILYFALRNIKLLIGLGVVLFFVILTFVGPLLTPYTPVEFVGPPGAPPSGEFWLGTTTFGEDVFTQFEIGRAHV
jgi:peptide/nickel transport system permease protein